MHLAGTHEPSQEKRMREREREILRGRSEEETECDGEEEFYHGIRFQRENEVQHFITGRYLLKCKHRLGISKVKLCVCIR